MASNSFVYTSFTQNPRPNISSSRGIQRTLSGGAAFPVELQSSQETEEVMQCRCECCGHIEECTREYGERIKRRFSGKWICGMCAEATEEEKSRHKCGNTEEALKMHMAACFRFNSYERVNPSVHLALRMKEYLSKKNVASAKLTRSNLSLHPRPKSSTSSSGGLMRSISCLPSISHE